MPATEVRAESIGVDMSVKQLSEKNATTFFPLYVWCRLRFCGFEEKVSIDKKSVKIQDKSVIKLYNTPSYDYTKKEKYSCELFFEALKFGKTKVSFKIGEKKYNVTIVIKQMQPIKSMTIKGINGGKNMKELIDNSLGIFYFGVILSSANVKNAKCKIKTQKGWYVDSIGLSENNQSPSPANPIKSLASKKFKHKGSTFTINLGRIQKKKNYKLNIHFVHKNGASTDGYIYLYDPKYL